MNAEYFGGFNSILLDTKTSLKLRVIVDFKMYLDVLCAVQITYESVYKS